MSEFRSELEHLINHESVEALGGNTPDFILAEYLCACLAAFDVATRARDAWYGHTPRIDAVLSGEATPTVPQACPVCDATAAKAVPAMHCESCDHVSYELKAAQQPECKCSMRTSLVGDGCEACNPEYADMLADDEDEDEQPEPTEWEKMRAAFVKNATADGLDLSEHPLHALFLNENTQAKWLAFKAGWQHKQQPEQPAQERECNACEWTGPEADAVMCGEIGPLCPECRETTTPQPAQQPALPIMARREWMPKWANYAGFAGLWEHEGTAGLSRPVLAFGDVPMHRIATHDEHNLPVIPREPGMPEGAKYRWRNGNLVWSYTSAPYLPSKFVEWQRIEDFNASGQEGRK